jgi:RNA polymerase sigma-70 factor (ECF subfamily)
MRTAPDFNHMLLSNTEFLKPFATLLTRDAEDAKDLFQETLYKALANREKYREGTNIRAWLYTIMRNIFINNYRRKSKRVVIGGALFQDFSDHFPCAGVQDTGVSGLQVKNIQKAIFDLPEIFKKPFILYYEGYRYQEIAALLQEPLGTIKSRIHFARKLLKKQIERTA